MTLQHRLSLLTDDRLRGMRRGIEKESLRTTPDAGLALTPHPRALGSALTHPHITTDFSESQIELVTGAFTRVEDVLGQLTELHQVVARHSREHHVVDMARMTQEAGTVVSAVMLGCIAGSGLLPFSRPDFEAAIGHAGAAAAASLRGFALGHEIGRAHV